MGCNARRDFFLFTRFNWPDTRRLFPRWLAAWLLICRLVCVGKLPPWCKMLNRCLCQKCSQPALSDGERFVCCYGLRGKERKTASEMSQMLFKIWLWPKFCVFCCYARATKASEHNGGKGKDVSTTPCRRIGWVEVQLHAFFDLGIRWKRVVSFTPRPLYHQGKSPWYPLDRRLGGARSRSGHGVGEKNSQPPPGIEPRSSDRPACSQSLCRLSYRGSFIMVEQEK
jgi:hypothetical protein